MNTPKYQIIVKDKSGIAIGEFPQFFNLKFSDKLNNFGTATFDLPVDMKEATSLISLRRYEIDILRDGVIKWSGEQANADVTLQTDSPNLVTITCFTYPEMLNSRYTLPFVRYESTDQAEILKAIIEESQGRTNGDFGFTFATITPTKDRDREYRLDNIMESLINMSNVIDGIDFWIDSNKVIHFASERGSDKTTQYVLEWGINVHTMQITDNFGSPANTVYGIGQSDGISQLIESYADSAARTTYLLREQTLSAIDVSESATLIAKAQDLVEKNKTAVRTIKVTQLPSTVPALDKINIGDSIGARVKKGRYDINSAFRVLGYESALGKDGEEWVEWILADTGHQESGVS